MLSPVSTAAASSLVEVLSFAEPGDQRHLSLHKKRRKPSIFHNPFARWLCFRLTPPHSQGAAITVLHSIQPDDSVPGATLEPALYLSLFGQMEAKDTAGRSVLPRSRKARGVLAVLALASPRPVLRTRLTGLLWSQRGREQARASLRQCVLELQRGLGPTARDLLRTERNHLCLAEDRLWIDVSALLRATASDPKPLELFQQGFLEDLVGLDPAFDAWLAEERQRLMQRAQAIAEAVLINEHEPQARISAAERLLSIDRAHESAWQSLIRAYLHLGDRDAARQAFERYQTVASCAGIVPSGELEALVRAAPLARAASALAAQSRGLTKGVRLVVLPARTLHGEGMEELLPGLAEEMTAAVSQFRWISCVVGNPLAQPTTSARRESDADYLLDSTLQRSGGDLRIIVRLLDVAAGHDVVWAHRFDRADKNLLHLQAEIAAETAARIDPQLLLREGERRIAEGAREATAWDLTLRAIPAIFRLEPSIFPAAGELLEAAVAMEPGNAAAHVWWAYWHLFLVGQAWASDPVAATLRASDLASRAVVLDPGDARALTLVGHILGFLHRRAEEACVLHERALSMNPNLPLAWCFSGLAHSYCGRHETAIEHISRAQVLSPHDPHAFFFDMALMMPYFLRREFEKALAVGRRSVELNSGFTSTYKGYLATLGQLEHREEARRVLARLLALEPGFCVKVALARSPMTRQCDLELYAEGLRRAGVPEV